MVARRRLDAELVRRKMARSREHAVEMIGGGRVLVGGMRAVKPATVVDAEESIRVIEGESDDWASRGAHKLLGAVEAFEPFGLSIEGRRVLDAVLRMCSCVVVRVRLLPWMWGMANLCGACKMTTVCWCWTARIFVI